MIILTNFLKMLIFVYFNAFALFLHLKDVSNRNCAAVAYDFLPASS